MNYHTSRTRFMALIASCLIPIALDPCTAYAQNAAPQNDAGAAIGSLFKSFMQAVQKAGDDTQPQAQAQAAPQPSPPQPIVPPRNLQKTSGLDYYIAIFKNSDPDVIRNYISTLKFQAKVIKWTDTNEFIVAIGPYVSEDERKRTADMILLKTPGLKPENLVTFVFKKGTPDNQLVTSQSAQNALQFDPTAFAESTSEQGGVALASAPAAQQVIIAQMPRTAPARPSYYNLALKCRAATNFRGGVMKARGEAGSEIYATAARVMSYAAAISGQKSGLTFDQIMKENEATTEAYRKEFETAAQAGGAPLSTFMNRYTAIEKDCAEKMKVPGNFKLLVDLSYKVNGNKIDLDQATTMFHPK